MQPGSKTSLCLDFSCLYQHTLYSGWIFHNMPFSKSFHLEEFKALLLYLILNQMKLGQVQHFQYGPHHLESETNRWRQGYVYILYRAVKSIQCPLLFDRGYHHFYHPDWWGIVTSLQNYIRNIQYSQNGLCCKWNLDFKAWYLRSGDLIRSAVNINLASSIS